MKRKQMNYNAGEEVANKIKRERKTHPETSNKINAVIESPPRVSQLCEAWNSSLSSVDINVDMHIWNFKEQLKYGET